MSRLASHRIALLTNECNSMVISLVLIFIPYKLALDDYDYDDDAIEIIIEPFVIWINIVWLRQPPQKVQLFGENKGQNANESLSVLCAEIEYIEAYTYPSIRISRFFLFSKNRIVWNREKAEYNCEHNRVNHKLYSRFYFEFIFITLLSARDF